MRALANLYASESSASEYMLGYSLERSVHAHRAVDLRRIGLEAECGERGNHVAMRRYVCVGLDQQRADRRIAQDCRCASDHLRLDAVDVDLDVRRRRDVAPGDERIELPDDAALPERGLHRLVLVI